MPAAPQSATSISDFKRCPKLFYFRHVLRLRLIESTDAQRQGTNWHGCLEVLRMTPGEPCRCNGRPQAEQEACPICEGGGFVPENLRDALIRYMDQVYAEKPNSIELADWELEKTILLYCAIAWQWYWQNDGLETLAREIPFSRQLDNMFSRRGRIDRIVRWENQVMLGEYKSTSKPIDTGSVYWDRLRLDTQPTFYLLEARRAQLAGELEPYGLKATDPLITGVLYDVWHKPKIGMKKLTFADAKKFFESGVYFGQEFECSEEGPAVGDATHVLVDGESAAAILGKIPKATKKDPDPLAPVTIRETPRMFGARLMHDIQEEPEKYFARKEITRTDDELVALDREYYNIDLIAEIMTRRDLWFRNENQCAVTFRCDYCPICHYNIEVTPESIPEGFHLI